MIIEFTKLNSILTLTLGMVLILVLNKYIFGGLTLIYGLSIGIQYGLSQLDLITKYLQYTRIPAYIFLAILVVTSFYVIYKSKTTNQIQKIFT